MLSSIQFFEVYWTYHRICCGGTKFLTPIQQQFNAASEDSGSALGVLILWQLQEGISAYYNRVGKQNCLGCRVFFEYPSGDWTWGKYLFSRTPSDSKSFNTCWSTCSLYISRGLLLNDFSKFDKLELYSFLCWYLQIGNLIEHYLSRQIVFFFLMDK